MMDVTELHDEKNLLVQMQNRWENNGSLDAIVDTHDPFTWKMLRGLNCRKRSTVF
jgi:hypothetical protein